MVYIIGEDSGVSLRFAKIFLGCRAVPENVKGMAIVEVDDRRLLWVTVLDSCFPLVDIPLLLLLLLLLLPGLILTGNTADDSDADLSAEEGVKPL